jgi:hypothetical protein
VPQRCCFIWVSCPSFFFIAAKDISPYLAIHRNQALTLFAFLGVVFLLLLMLVGGLSYGMVYHRNLVESGPTEVWLLSFIRKLLIVWLVFWAYSVFRALRGSPVPVPYLSVLSSRRYLHRTGMATLIAIFMALSAIVPLLIVADAQVSDVVEEGSVFMVYEDQGRFPRCLFSLAVFPIARASIKHYGPGSMVLLPISPDSIRAAINHGVVVIIASHGTSNGLLLEGGYFTPSDLLPRENSDRLKYVYFAGCDSGTQRSAWEEALRPAQVHTYDRLTPVLEHLWWFWTKGPSVVYDSAT